MISHITLSPETVSDMCPECKAMLSEALGLTFEQPAQVEDDEDGEYKYAELGVQAARAFLLGCGEKTTAAIRLIVDAGEEFLGRDIQAGMPDPTSGLRGVWTGLTKRTHTITGSDNVELIEWLEELEDGSWRGKLTPKTRESFRRALPD